ncbi:MAG: hypothetical protein IJX77_09245 [Ruminococcus sp.]|nr:hypothetical protein [Ruminococcus sp.]
MITLLSYKVNLKNEALRYRARLLRIVFGSVFLISAGAVLLAVMSIKLDPQPQSPEGWAIAATLILLSLLSILGIRFAVNILASAYSVFTLYRDGQVTVTPLAEVASKNIGGKVRGSLLGVFRRTGLISRKMQEFAERYDFEDFFAGHDFGYYYSHRIKKLRSIRRIGKYTVIRCKTEKYNPIAKKQTVQNCAFYIDKSDFENAEELISVLESQLRLQCH